MTRGFNFRSYIKNDRKEASILASFRVLFGVLMLLSLVRFISMGWVEDFYISPKFHFKYYGFEWVKTWGNYTYVLFGIAIAACIGIILGFRYKISMVLFFLTFTYIELIDKTTYLNHYYFISILSFLLCFLPLNATFSVDSFKSKINYKYVPAYTIDSIKLLLGIVYFYAGLAKLNSDWLLKAQPLKIWLSSKTDLWLVGPLMKETWFHYTMSWSGALYDLTIPFLLLYKKTRPFAFVLVVIFHVFTRILFNIGMFPYIMIVATLVFFNASVHNNFISFIKRVLSLNHISAFKIREKYALKNQNIKLYIISIFFVIQLLLPFRNLLYPEELFWHEQGYRFSWRVMLMEKVGETQLIIKNGVTGKYFYVDNTDFLTSFQIKQMSFQPDFILEYAHKLGDHFKSQGHENIQIFAESYVALNGRLNQQFINPTVDLYKQKEGFKHKTWVLPFKDEIKGF
ncbi:HTTM domain-containing protein [Seonamhaeicola algicola]|uniref:HTTM domain-containing protein n=1 Tax=Seonamhaeicola algicola TaxID=1719036 RepID=A0A5C7ATC1_9FLAO|nr:HTTM domain-containing protein [Seonamhaeicola algicola]TXE11986.1 HTTM domain-containing protein [Seonamhaeicola algicola]